MTTGIPYAQLSPALRKQVDAALGSQPKASKDRRTGREQGLPLTCHGCGSVLDNPSESAINTHAKKCPNPHRFEWRAAG